MRRVTLVAEQQDGRVILYPADAGNQRTAIQRDTPGLHGIIGWAVVTYLDAAPELP